MRNVSSLPKLFLLMKKYQLLANSQTGSEEFGKAYEFILHCLEKGKNTPIQEALEAAAKENDEETFENISSLTLTTIHRFTYLENDKEYASTLFIVPYFTSALPEDEGNIHYPPLRQIQDIFKKHFFHFGLIDDPTQLHIPGIKINSDIAYSLDYSDWFEIHKQGLIKALQPETDEFHEQDITISIPEQGDLSFFPLLITHEDTEYIKEPKICNAYEEDLPIENVLEAIEKDVQILSGTGLWSLGVPSHCENALNFGLEIQQDFELDIFFRTFSQKSDIEMAIIPLDNCDIGLLAWNNRTNTIEHLLELYHYSDSEEEFIDTLLQQISFYEIPKTYIFEEAIHFSLDVGSFDLNDIASNNEVIVLEKEKTIKPTLH